MKAFKTYAIFISLTATITTLFMTVPSLGQQPASTENVRITRLAGLGKIWGAVKYFHPYLAYREIDWDRALIEAIPKVNAAKTPQQYEAAVNQMLAALNDKDTHAEITPEKPTAATGTQTPSVEKKEPVALQNGILTIDVNAAAKAVSSGANSLLNQIVTRASQFVPQAKGIVIDLRSGESDDGTSFYFDALLRAIIPAVLDHNVPAGSIRYRMHSGYATQTGSGASFYYSGTTTVAPQTFGGINKSKTPPIVFLVNENSPSIDMAAGLQSAGLAYLVQDGTTAKDISAVTTTLKLPDQLSVKMRVGELVNPDGSIGFTPDSISAKSEAMQTAEQILARDKPLTDRAKPSSVLTPQVSQKEKTYAEMEFPSPEYRLMALFRYWNVLNYFYPYKHLIEGDWSEILPKYIPKFEGNKDAADYQLTVREMVAEMHDSHGGVGNGNASAERLGTYYPPFLVGFIENQTVVTKVVDEKLPLKAGDIVLSVDGEPVEKRRDFLSRYIAASTPQSLMRNVHTGLLRGQKDSLLKLRVRGISGGERDIEVTRTLTRTDPKLAAAAARTTPVFEILPSGFGYVDLARLTVADVDKMFEAIKNAPGTLFDMRGYPNGTAWSIAPRLTTTKSPVAALFSRPILEATSLNGFAVADDASYAFVQKLPERHGDVYAGKVAMLINEDAISQSEYTCMFFQTARPDIAFIGTPTVGANGDVTLMVLPGNLTVSFTGHNVRHADGRQLQRVGIQPTIKAAPTIHGITEGRDEILDAGIKYLQESVKK